MMLTSTIRCSRLWPRLGWMTTRKIATNRYPRNAWAAPIEWMRWLCKDMLLSNVVRNLSQTRNTLLSVVKWDRGPGHKYGLRQHAVGDHKCITWARCEFYGDMFARCFDGAVKRQISFWGRIRRTCCQPGLKTEARLEKVTADVCDSVWKKWQESIFRFFVNVWLLQKVTSEDWGHECYLSWSLFVSASPSTAKRQILWWSHETCTLTRPDIREKKRRSHVFIWICLPNDQFVRFN